MKVNKYGKILRGVRKALPYARAAVRGYKAYKGWTETYTKKKGYQDRAEGVTQQYDRARQYRRRRAPKRVRMRARRRARKFKADFLRTLATRTAFMNESMTDQSTVGDQLWSNFILNGFYCGSSSTYAYGFRDWNYICGRDYLIGDLAGDAQSRWSGGSRKFIVDTAIMDLTIYNSSFDSPDENKRVPAEVDLYEVVFGKKKYTDVTQSLLSQIQTIQTNWVGRQGDPTQIVQLFNYQRGITPFEFGRAMSQLGIKIIKKTKYFVPAGSTITHQIRDSKNRIFNYVDITGESMMYPPGARGLMVIAKTVVGSTTSASSGVARLNYGVTRKYKYKVLESNGEKAAFYRDVS